MKNFIILIFCLLNIKYSYARIANKNESEVVYKKLEISRNINENGTYELDYYALIEIKKEIAKSDYGLYRFKYNPKSESVTNISARTINGTKSFKVPKSDIIIKPISSQGPGFDTKNQITIPFSNVDIGSLLEIKYHLKNTVPYIPGLYSDMISIGYRGLIENHKEIWKSKKPINFEIKDVDNYYSIKQAENVIELNLKRPIFLRVIEEEDSLRNPVSLVWIGVSTMREWSDYPVSTINHYEKVIESPLTPIFNTIYQKAKEQISPIDQINTVTSNLANEVRYLGDWRLVKGAYHSRTLKQISDTKYGDCKDFSVSTAAILRKLGYETHVSLIYRDRNYFEIPLALPLNDFNHAIVWAKKDGEVYWIDPTNTISYAQGIFPDIENRRALILKPTGAEISKTPKLNYKNSVIENKLKINFINNEELEGSGQVLLKGYGASSLTALGLSRSKPQIDFMIIQWLTKIPELISWNFSNFDLTSRVVQDFSTELSFSARWHPVITSAGKGYLISSKENVKRLNFPSSKRLTSLKLTEANTFINKISFVGDNLFLAKEVECDGDSDWFEYKRRLKKSNDDILLEDYVGFKTSVISIEDIKTEKFVDQQSKILSCMGDFVIVFKK